METSELLREARRAALRARREGTVKAAMEAEEAWVRYYESKYAETRDPEDLERLRQHREKLEAYQASMKEVFSHTVTCVCGATVTLEYKRDQTVQTACPECGRKLRGYALDEEMGTVVITYRVG